MLSDRLVLIKPCFQGTAEVVFSRRGDALAAVKRYNNVQLDGKLMKIEIVGTNLSAQTPTTPLAPVQFPFPSSGILGNFNENYNGGFNGNFNGNFRFVLFSDMFS